jgi:uncharacterized protein (TIGR04255 family)
MTDGEHVTTVLPCRGCETGLKSRPLDWSPIRAPELYGFDAGGAGMQGIGQFGAKTMKENESSQLPHGSRAYPRPPITECVIEIRFSQEKEASLLERIRDKLADQFPKIETNIEQHFQFNIEDGSSSISPSRVSGFKMTNADGNGIIILNKFSFAYSRLPPYPGWDFFKSQFVELWSKHKSIAEYSRISRVGVRYINRIDIPVSGENAKISARDYLNIHIVYPLAALTAIDQFAIQLVTNFDDVQLGLVLNIARTESPVPNNLAIILDLDFGRTEDVPQKDADIWNLLDLIRSQKNKTFEACITDATRSLFS